MSHTGESFVVGAALYTSSEAADGLTAKQKVAFSGILTPKVGVDPH